MVLTAESPVAVIMGLDRGINHEQIKIAIRAVLGGAVLIGTNPDLLLPCDDGFEPGAGLYLTAVATATRTQPVIVGKPETHLIRAALERLGTNPSETIMIGDQIPTDIQAGKAAGLFSVLVLTGVPPVNDKSLVPPDLVIKDLSEMAIVVPADQGEQHG
jgi:4-nitrophenyl phosphatase